MSDLKGPLCQPNEIVEQISESEMSVMFVCARPERGLPTLDSITYIVGISTDRVWTERERRSTNARTLTSPHHR